MWLLRSKEFSAPDWVRSVLWGHRGIGEGLRPEELAMSVMQPSVRTDLNRDRGIEGLVAAGVFLGRGHIPTHDPATRGWRGGGCAMGTWPDGQQRLRGHTQASASGLSCDANGLPTPPRSMSGNAVLPLLTPVTPRARPVMSLRRPRFPSPDTP